MEGDGEHAGTTPPVGGRSQGEEESALVDATEAARMCKISVSMFYKMTRAGQTPKPIKFGKLMRWHRKTLFEWIESGCQRIGVNELSESVERNE